MAQWPESLPQSFQGGSSYKEIPENTVLRTTMDTGITKLRRRQTRSNSKVSGVLILTSAQATVFIDFFQNTVKGGSIAFTGILTRSGLTQTYQFAEEPSVEHIGGDVYQASLTLLVLPQ